jgi:hypothetical protein
MLSKSLLSLPQALKLQAGLYLYIVRYGFVAKIQRSGARQQSLTEDTSFET